MENTLSYCYVNSSANIILDGSTLDNLCYSITDKSYLRWIFKRDLVSRLNSTGILIHTCTELCCFPFRCFQKYKKPRKIVPSALPRLLLVLALLLDSELRVDGHRLSHVNSCIISLRERVRE